MNQSSKRFLFDLPGRYRIRVQGQLSASWSSRLSDKEEAPSNRHMLDCIATVTPPLQLRTVTR